MTTSVLICGRLGRHGLDPEALERELRDLGDHVSTVDDLCADELALRRVAHGPEHRFVVAVCPQGPSADEVRARARRAGLDPGSGTIRLDVAGAASWGEERGRVGRAARILHAGVARLEALPTSPPDGFRLRLPKDAVSRRSLFSMASASAQPVAVVGQGPCVGSTVCGVCVDACPVDAIAASGRVPRADRDLCIACGGCVTACPIDGAVQLPGSDLTGFEAQLTALLDASDVSLDRPGLLVTCRGAPPIPPARLPGTWLPMDVPCMSIITSGWALEAIRLGASSIAFRGCGGACPAAAAERLRERAAFAVEALRAAGVGRAEARAWILLPEDDDDAPHEASPEAPRSLPASPDGSTARLREPAGTTTFLMNAAAAGSIDGEGSPLGDVAVDADGCTACGSCALVCPTGAFRFEDGPVVAAIDLDRDLCIGCGHCASICPEQVISVDRGLDLGSLGGGPTMVKRSPMARCRRCGGPVAPEAMLARVRSALDGDERALDAIEGLCLACRGSHDRTPSAGQLEGGGDPG
jgi:ferredoxin